MSEKSGWGVGKWIGCGCGGCLLLVVAIVAVVAAVGGLAFFGMKKAEPYQEALRRAQENPAVIAVLGEPVEAGLLMSGSISIDGSSGEADLAFPISGPEGSGTVYVIGEKRAGRWEYTTMEVEIDATGERINLLETQLEFADPISIVWSWRTERTDAHISSFGVRTTSHNPSQYL